MWSKSGIRAIILFLLFALMTACGGYKSREVSFRHPSGYENVQQAAGAQIGAEAYADKASAKDAFGFDIIDAGLLPIQVVIDNAGSGAVEIVADQTFLIDTKGEMWNLLDSRTAYERLEKSSEFARVSKSAGKSAGFGAIGGAIVGAAIGILSGENVGDTAMRGAAVGGAGGAVVGGGKELSTREGARQITRDMRSKELENKPIQSGSIGRGFLFFPSEADSARKLRLQIEEADTAVTHTLFFDL